MMRSRGRDRRGGEWLTQGQDGMESAAVFLIGIAIVWLVFWTVRNDGVPAIRDQRGVFRMRPPAAARTGARQGQDTGPVPGDGDAPEGP